MTRLEVARQRLRNLWLSDPKPGQPADVVRWLGAVQAQDYAATRWALAMRLQGAVDAGIEAAFMAGEILRTHLLRPTWHFVTPADIRWLLALTAPRVHVANAHMVRKLELDESTFRRSNDALVRALQGGHHCTRQELRQVLEEAGIAAGDGIRLSYLLMRDRGQRAAPWQAVHPRAAGGTGAAGQPPGPAGGPGRAEQALLHEPGAGHRSRFCQVVGADSG